MRGLFFVDLGFLSGEIWYGDDEFMICLMGYFF